MKKFLLVLIAVLALAVSPAFAQNGVFAPYVNGSMSVSATNGISITAVENPSYQIGGGIESSTNKWLLDVNGQFASANFAGLKGAVTNTGGYTGTVTGSAYRKIFKKVLVGGGAYWSNQVANGQAIGGDYLKASFNYKQVRPFVGVGYQFNRDRLIVNYALPGIDEINGLKDVQNFLEVSFNGIHSQTFLISNEIFVGKKGLMKHVRLTQNVVVNSGDTNFLGFFESDVPIRTSTITAGAGLKFVF